MANDDMVIGHSEFVPYPTPRPDPTLAALLAKGNTSKDLVIKKAFDTVEVTYKGETFVHCRSCSSYGRPRRAHRCGENSNWYQSPQALIDREARSAREFAKNQQSVKQWQAKPAHERNAILTATPGSALPGGAVSFEHLAAQTQARRSGSSPKCAHGYWVHQHDPCPKCWGVHSGRNDDVIPHVGEGNGWMLRRGDVVCIDCGGPGNAGYGVLPEGITANEFARQDVRPKQCYGCSLKSSEPIVKRNDPRRDLLASGWEGTDLPAVRRGAPAQFNPGKERF